MTAAKTAGWRNVLLLIYVAIYVVAVVAILGALIQVSPFAALAAGGLYLVSHLLRAMRLAALSVDMLGVSVRTTMALHFATAPFSLLLPWKLGELVRLIALWRTSGAAVYSVIVLLIDRMYDSLFLLPIVLVLVSFDGASPILATLTVLMAIIPLTVLAIGPRFLKEVQRYVVSRPDNLISLDTLHMIDALRRLVSKAATVSSRQAPQLCVISLVIWLCELLVCALLISAAAPLLSGSIDLLGERLVTSWGITPPGTLVDAALTLTLVAQLLPWPVMAMIFLDRARIPPADRTRKNEKVIG